MNISFLFGAGAEVGKCSFGLPSGSDYTLKTMQHRHEKLYQVLRSFYGERLSDSYVDEYRPQFLFDKDSHTFREIIYRAALKYIKDDNEIDSKSRQGQYIEKVREAESLRNLESSKRDKCEKLKQVNGEIKELSKAVYDLIVKNADEKDEDEWRENVAEEKKTLKNYLLFYGAVEKDFSAIINPKKVGLTQFWRVINYYWSAFFTILEPLCTNFVWYKSLNDKESFYKYVLCNLEDVLRDVYNEYDYVALEKDTSKTGNYYRAVSENFPDSFAITTNYTPFAEHYFEKKCVYLAGRLSEFEVPEELSVKDVRREKIKRTDFIFPFLMTQAPVKPIIVPNQIREYFQAIQELEKRNTLVIIGYSLGEADNHINAILREFAQKKENRILYCAYSSEDNKSIESIKENVTKALKMDKHSENITVVRNDGNADTLMQKLKELI